MQFLIFRQILFSPIKPAIRYFIRKFFGGALPPPGPPLDPPLVRWGAEGCSSPLSPPKYASEGTDYIGSDWMVAPVHY